MGTSGLSDEARKHFLAQMDQARAGAREKPKEVTVEDPAVIVRTYRGWQRQLAAKLSSEISEMASRGYAVESQVVVPGHKSFLHSKSNPPKDQVVVTFRKREP